VNAPSRLAAFLAAIAVVFGVAFLTGQAIGPEVEAEAHDEEAHDEEAHDEDGHGVLPDGVDERSAYALRLGSTQVRAGDRQTVSFRVLDEQGRAVTAYDERHERDLHLIAVAESDLRDYQHVHPTLRRSGVWSVDLDLAPGAYRLYADTQPAGADAMVLESRLLAAGDPPGRTALPEPGTTARVGPYAVALHAEHGRMTFSVSLRGRPVTDLQPYLGAFGHLVVIREDDLAYLHAHPEDGPAGPEVAFDVEFDGAGRHALYLDFKHGGVVRTAMFTVDAGASGEAHEEEHDGH
jgi:hypothetical protein